MPGADTTYADALLVEGLFWHGTTHDVLRRYANDPSQAQRKCLLRDMLGCMRKYVATKRTLDSADQSWDRDYLFNAALPVLLTFLNSNSVFQISNQVEEMKIASVLHSAAESIIRMLSCGTEKSVYNVRLLQDCSRLLKTVLAFHPEDVEGKLSESSYKPPAVAMTAAHQRRLSEWVPDMPSHSDDHPEDPVVCHWKLFVDQFLEMEAGDRASWSDDPMYSDGARLLSETFCQEGLLHDPICRDGNFHTVVDGQVILPGTSAKAVGAVHPSGLPCVRARMPVSCMLQCLASPETDDATALQLLVIINAML